MNRFLQSAAVAAVLFSAVASVSVGARAAETPPPLNPADPMVRVGATVITAGEFVEALQNAVRQKYYHGKVQASQMTELQQTVADQLADRVLLLDEARRQGLTADEKKIRQTLDGYDQRYRGNPNYEKTREQTHAAIRARLEEQDLIAQVEAKARTIAPPTEAEVRAFYDANPDLFREPEKQKVSMILLRVDPSSPPEEWKQTMERAKGLEKELKAGADFADLAKKHSGDASAARGGDLGYLHRGMLPDNVQERLDKAADGEVLEPFRILEGVGIFRLDGKQAARLRGFEDVKQRATDLLQRQRSAQAWKDFVADLRRKTPVTVETGRFAEVNALLGVTQ